jgi:two-component system phosphate regulon response regulator PhoB
VAAMAKVLIVDDDPDAIKLIATYVEKEGHTPLSAANTTEAKKALSQDPSLIFLDIDLPGETGVMFAIRMRMQEKYKKIPIVFVTAYPERGDRLVKADPEKTDIISKPFKKEQLLDALKKYCK